MYLDYWGLSAAPFPADLDPERFYPSATHDEALARLEFLFEQRHRLGLVCGPSGSGKSHLLEVFARRLRRAGHPAARISLAGRTARELVAELAQAWCLGPREDESRAALWQRIDDRLHELRFQRLSAAVIFDDVQYLDDEKLGLVLRLSQLELGLQAHLAVVLACPTRFVPHLAGQVLERCPLAIELEPWDWLEASRFLRWALARVGRQAPTFDSQAASRLCALAHGLPRRIAQLAELALVAGAGAERQTIDGETIDAVCEQLSGSRSLAIG